MKTRYPVPTGPSSPRQQLTELVSVIDQTFAKELREGRRKAWRIRRIKRLRQEYRRELEAHGGICSECREVIAAPNYSGICPDCLGKMFMP